MAAAVFASSAWTPAGPEPATARTSIADELTEVVASLRSDLEAIIRSASGSWRAARYSVLAVSLDRGDTLFMENAGMPLAPASNMKLLTTATAIQRLGPSFRYQTFLLGTGRVVDGVLQGDLILYGTGDPGISDRFQPGAKAVFEAFADSLLAAGIYAVRGNLIGDGSYFSGPLLGDGWNPDDLNDSFAAPSGALAFNENVFQLRVRSAGELGTTPEILTMPEGADVPIQNDALVGTGRSLLVWRRSPLEPITVQGTIPRGSAEIWRQMTVQDPAHFSASVLRTVLEEKGIRVDGEVRVAYGAGGSTVTGRTLWAPSFTNHKAPRVLATHVSPPLVDYLTVVNKRSHNLLADQVLKTVGRVVEGDGSFAGGSRAVTRFMTDSVGVGPGLEIHDGSGLSELNRVSASNFVALLSYMSRRGDWNTLWQTLPEAGNPRELRRMYRTAAAGNLRAKTGTIQNVSALSGMVHSATGERIAFSIIVNDVPSTSRAKGIEDRIGTRLAAFERTVEPGSDLGIALTDLTTDSSTVQPLSVPDPVPGGSGAGSATEPQTTVTPQQQPHPTQATTTASATDAGKRHQVRSGENFSVIAREYGIAVDALVDANPGLSPRRLQPGMWVKIP